MKCVRIHFQSVELVRCWRNKSNSVSFRIRKFASGSSEIEMNWEYEQEFISGQAIAIKGGERRQELDSFASSDTKGRIFFFFCNTILAAFRMQHSPIVAMCIVVL